MDYIDNKRNKINVLPCADFTAFECLWYCIGCREFFKKINGEQDKREIKEENGEVEVLVNESGDLEKCSIKEVIKSTS